MPDVIQTRLSVSCVSIKVMCLHLKMNETATELHWDMPWVRVDIFLLFIVSKNERERERNGEMERQRCANRFKEVTSRVPG